MAPRGGEPYAPEVLLGLLFYGYATGVFSSRKIERATYEAVPFRFIAGNLHPDHDTIATFRRTFLAELKGLFVQVLLLAQEAGVLTLGTHQPGRDQAPRRRLQEQSRELQAAAGDRGAAARRGGGAVRAGRADGRARAARWAGGARRDRAAGGPAGAAGRGQGGARGARPGAPGWPSRRPMRRRWRSGRSGSARRDAGRAGARRRRPRRGHGTATSTTSPTPTRAS